MNERHHLNETRSFSMKTNLIGREIITQNGNRFSNVPKQNSIVNECLQNQAEITSFLLYVTTLSPTMNHCYLSTSTQLRRKTITTDQPTRSSLISINFSEFDFSPFLHISTLFIWISFGITQSIDRQRKWIRMIGNVKWGIWWRCLSTNQQSLWERSIDALFRLAVHSMRNFANISWISLISGKFNRYYHPNQILLFAMLCSITKMWFSILCADDSD